eukprot:SAG11_NODE_4036_length_2095_cov_1.346693_4_plen_121_part_00
MHCSEAFWVVPANSIISTPQCTWRGLKRAHEASHHNPCRATHAQVSKALELCFKAELHDALRRISDDLGKDTDPVLMAQCAEHFMRHGQYEKAVQLQLTAGRLKEALRLCSEHNVNVTEE